MSTFVQKDVDCPHCEVSQTATVAVSVNGERHGEVHIAIRAGLFQQALCTGCGERFEIDLPMVYMDFSQRLWVFLYPKLWEHRWRELEHEPKRAFRTNMVDHAPMMVRDWGEDFRVRAVFGLSALREKILLHEAGLDDAWVEVAKLDLLRRGVCGPFHADSRPRVTAVEEDHIIFGGVTLLRSRVREMMDGPVDWVRGHSAVTGGPYVDVGRLLCT